MRTRLVIAFIVVALLSAIASSWFHTLIASYHLSAWLDDVILGPGWLRSMVHSDPGSQHPTWCAIPLWSSSGSRLGCCSR